MTTKELFQIVTTITQENIEVINKSVKKLSDKQLNWIPNPGVWSVAQILAHLNEYGKYYHPTFVKKIENTRFTSTKEAFVSSPLGRSAWKSMKLGNAKNVKRKFKAPKGYNPTLDNSLLDGDGVNTFLGQQENFLQIIEKAKDVNVRKVKIPISISKIVRLRLGDALLYVTYHNQRHVQQILNLRNSQNFPKK
ncbi:MAG: DinB family protein [Crocinitomicaceae bacterium]|nr:DinB family protein [Crocinitomicaceae bacterium]